MTFVIQAGGRPRRKLTHAEALAGLEAVCREWRRVHPFPSKEELEAERKKQAEAHAEALEDIRQACIRWKESRRDLFAVPSRAGGRLTNSIVRSVHFGAHPVSRVLVFPFYGHDTGMCAVFFQSSGREGQREGQN